MNGSSTFFLILSPVLVFVSIFMVLTLWKLKKCWPVLKKHQKSVARPIMKKRVICNPCNLTVVNWKIWPIIVGLPKYWSKNLNFGQNIWMTNYFKLWLHAPCRMKRPPWGFGFELILVSKLPWCNSKKKSLQIRNKHISCKII